MSSTRDSLVPRLVVVDDTDPTIQYSPASAFTLDSTGKLDSIGYGGPVFNQTITGTTTAASFSYKFNGTYVRVMFAAEGSSSQPWNCTVDNHEIINFLVETGEITNIFACDSADILQGTTGEHTLNVQIIPNDSTTNATQSTVWLDSILYQPLPTDPLDSVMLRIHNSDPSVSYGNSSGAWTFQGYQSNATGTTATSMNFAFNGSSVTLYSVNFGNPIYNASTAFYTIDGTSSTDFVLPGSTNVSSTGNYTDIINYPLFTASDLSESHHNIEVATSYNASENPQWLAINYFIVKTNPANSTSPDITTNSTSPPTSSSTSSDTTHHNYGPIVGGIIGGLVGLAALLLLFVFLRKRRRNSYSGMMLDLTDGPGFYRSNSAAEDTLEVTPFINSAAPPGISIPMKYSDIGSADTAYTGQSSSNSEAPVSGSSTRSFGWNSDRLITKNPQLLQLQDEQIRMNEIRQHMDSGVRLPSASEEIVDVPPTYTED